MLKSRWLSLQPLPFGLEYGSRATEVALITRENMMFKCGIARFVRDGLGLPRRPGLALISFLVGSLFVSHSAARADAVQTKSDMYLRKISVSSRSTGWMAVIVRLKGGLDAVTSDSLAAVDADIYRRLPIIHSVAVRVPTRNLNKLAALAMIEHISADVSVRKCDEFTVGRSGADVAFSQSGLSGLGVTVAGVDSGIDPHL